MKRTALIFIVLLLGFLLANSLYTVGEAQQVILTQFGKPVGQPITEAG